MFEHMDHPAFVDCVKPKAQRALSLHHAVQHLDLNFFVMTSSILALLGNIRQSNYSVANSVLDALALQRCVSHLAATSLVLSMVLDVDVMAENDAIETSLTRKGFTASMNLRCSMGLRSPCSAALPKIQMRWTRRS